MKPTAIEEIILKHYHGFTLEQWRQNLVNEFPYSEIPSIVQTALNKSSDIDRIIIWRDVETDPPKLAQQIILKKPGHNNLYITKFYSNELGQLHEHKGQTWIPYPS